MQSRQPAIVRAEKKEAEQEQQKKTTVNDLLKLATTKGIGPLAEICRKAATIWNENAASVYGGSFVYWVTSSKGWRLLFGINVSGERKNAPGGCLDVWIPTKNLAEVTGGDSSEIRLS